jgi:alkanesulfonate monooxygenase SsuD/methylene tetrahydromethanopterin reductase-like flavin-dependent oxidoreductase (luciferase family)
MAELIGAYRAAWQAAGHDGRGKVMLAFHMFAAASNAEAARIAREPLNRYLKSLVAAASDWTTGTSSRDYPGYDKIVESLSRETFETQVEKGAAWVGDPATIRASIAKYHAQVGGFESASLQVNFNTIALQDAEASMRLFARDVIPALRGL